MFARRGNKWFLVLAVLTACAVVAAPTVRADQVKLNVALSHPVLEAGRAQTAYLKVGMEGFKMETEEERTPINVALVLDKSGSMSGEKIRRARKAAIMAVKRLHDDDIVSVILYDDDVKVLVPATKAQERDAIIEKIRTVGAGGSTALYAGVKEGGRQVKKFLDKNRINRIVLMSDGLANVGPDSVEEVAGLGSKLHEGGIAVTTIGLGTGYNEDMMTQLAVRSEGNHFFAENARDLEKGFDLEFSIGMAVVAQNVKVNIRCAEQVRPMKLLNGDGKIDGNTVSLGINQIYSGREAKVLLKLNVPATPAGETRKIADVTVRYDNMQTKTKDKLTSEISARFVEDRELVKRKVRKDVMVPVMEQRARRNSEKAVELRDRGKVKKAQEVLRQNADMLAAGARKYKSEKLGKRSAQNEEDAKKIEEKAEYEKQRKKMRDRQAEEAAPSLAY